MSVGTKQVGLAVTLLIHPRDWRVLGSILGWDIDNPEVSPWFSSVSPDKWQNTSITPPPHPSKSFPIHHS
jgi:hypothetical protein